MNIEELTDNLAREVYQVRSQSAREMTDERWERIKQKFPGSVRACRAEAVRIIEEDELF